jgi:hypothetical protein
MIETLMALWNRGVRGRLMVMMVTFFCICISISLLFVTAGSVWGSLFAHGRGGGGGEETRVVNAALITATAPGAVSTSPVAVTPTITPDPCLASPTGANGLTPHVRGTEKSGGTSVPIYRTTATPTPIQRHKPPTPGVTATPKPKPTPSPTFSAVTPTATATPRVTPTLTLTGTPAITPTTLPTVVVKPTDTTTPGATPTGTALPGITPSPGILPTDTSTPNATPTALVTPTVFTTPTVTMPVSSPTAVKSATAGSNDTRASDGGSVMSGTPSIAQSGQSGEGSCYSDNLAASGVGAVLSMLQNFLWLILASSLVGTALFCAQVYRVVIRRGRG